MSLLRNASGSPLELRLARNLVRSIKRGHPWVYGDSLRQLPPAPPGSPAILLDNKKGREIARGFYDPDSPLALRICTAEPEERLDEGWARQRLERALTLRQTLFDENTTGFRLLNGEGDGMPGLICDLYGDTAVIQLDGAGPAGFWDVTGIARWLAQSLSLRCVYRRPQSRSGAAADSGGEALFGQFPTDPVYFLEYGVSFTADPIRGQKTGFFLDQRDNRQRLRPLATGRRVLNLFGYTGGFSVYAGLGGAEHVTTVDLAAPALAEADYHWRLNDLPPDRHHSIDADAFEFLESTAQGTDEPWELVIIDPPSFASSKESLPQALAAYQRLVAGGAAVTGPNGILAAASCSSHVGLEPFLSACEEGISQARRRATVLGIHGQPADHPAPLVLPEFRYLKFVVMRVE